MFARLFAESGLSLDRLRALVEVGASGSIVQAAPGDPVRQSQLSRQIKELEDFFKVPLTERLGHGIRLTENGRELARIARFCLLGLSNFQRGCLAEDRTYRLGASATFLQRIWIPLLAEKNAIERGVNYVTEVLPADAIERRLHDLTLDFGVLQRAELSRPLQSQPLATWRLRLFVPRALHGNPQSARRAWSSGNLAWVAAGAELPPELGALILAHPPQVTCASFLEAREAFASGTLAVILPEDLAPATPACHSLVVPGFAAAVVGLRFAWNPRLLRLNSQAARRRDYLAKALSARLRAR